MTSRRELLGMLLGAPFALACRGDRGNHIPPGTLVDTGMRRGHAAIRDAGDLGGESSRIEPTTWRHHRVAIVGAGIAGLAAAWELARRGVEDVVILELDDHLGGTARGGSSTVTPYPWGAHYIVAPQLDQPDLIALLEDMNAIEDHRPDGTPIVHESLRCRELEERLLYRGRWYEGLYLEAGASADDLAQRARFDREVLAWAAFRDDRGRRAFALPTSRASHRDELLALDQRSFAAWLDARGFTSPRLRWLCDYACRDDFDLLAADTSAWAGLFYFASRRGSSGDYQSVITWPDGNHALVRHFAERATRARYRFERGATIMRASPDGSLVAVGPAGSFGIRAERVILAVPGFVANRLVADRPRLVDDVGAWAVANIHLRERPRDRAGAPAAWDNVFRDSPSLGYVSATHQRGRDRGPTVWTWFYPFTGPAHEVRTQLAGATYEDWAEVVLRDLERAHLDVRTHIEHIEIAFWGHGMIRPRVGSMFHPVRAERLLPRGKLHFAHTDLSGMALFEEAFDHGLRAAREVVAAL